MLLSQRCPCTKSRQGLPLHSLSKSAALPKQGACLLQCRSHAAIDLLSQQQGKGIWPWLLQILPVSSVSASAKPSLGVGRKPSPRRSQDSVLQAFCDCFKGPPDVSSNGSLMSARSLGRPRYRQSASQQPLQQLHRQVLQQLPQQLVLLTRIVSQPTFAQAV